MEKNQLFPNYYHTAFHAGGEVEGGETDEMLNEANEHDLGNPAGEEILTNAEPGGAAEKDPNKRRTNSLPPAAFIFCFNCVSVVHLFSVNWMRKKNHCPIYL